MHYLAMNYLAWKQAGVDGWRAVGPTHRLLATLPALLALFACNDPVGPGSPELPEVVGTYQSEQLVTSTLMQVESAATLEMSCNGELIIEQQSGATFSAALVQRDCTAGDQAIPQGPVVAPLIGTLTADGGVSLIPTMPATFPIRDVLFGLSCGPLDRAPLYRGTFANGQITVVAVAGVECGQSGPMVIEHTISGSRD